MSNKLYLDRQEERSKQLQEERDRLFGQIEQVDTMMTITVKGSTYNALEAIKTLKGYSDIDEVIKELVWAYNAKLVKEIENE